MLHHPRRFDRLQYIRTLDPDRDYHTIYRLTALYEFPFDVRMGLLLAFWRTFAVPSIAEVLAGTGETTRRTARRADDTGILMYELIDHGLDHPRGRAANRRLNQIHRHFPIRNDDYLYVLGTFVFVGLRWIDQHGWRDLCCHERQAAFNFYVELGRRMNIADIPRTLTAYAELFDSYERERFAYSAAAEDLMRATKGLLADLPRPLAASGRQIADALLDEPLRTATGIPDPPATARAAVRAVLGTRAWLLRRAFPPRRRSILDGGITAKTYPNGYDLSAVGSLSRRSFDAGKGRAY
jgi:ER-bound oxygenase mpaB/B'/Rubber oxygenase, catalytic domain